MLREDLVEKMPCEQKLEGDEGINHSAYLGEKVQGIRSVNGRYRIGGG